MEKLIPDVTHNITLEMAVEMTTRYRDNKDKILKDEYIGRNIMANSETFNRDAFDRLLAQPGCAGVRFYYSMDEELRFHAIVVGVNEKNEDILPGNAGSIPENEGGVIVEEGQLCPPGCGIPSLLNP